MVRVYIFRVVWWGVRLCAKVQIRLCMFSDNSGCRERVLYFVQK